MNFEWGLFQFTMTDCKILVNGLKATPTLHTLRVTSSKMGEEEGRVLVKGLLQHPGLVVLGKNPSILRNTYYSHNSSDLSQNKLGSRTGRALGKLLSIPTCPLETLVLTNNEISRQGGEAIGHSLKANTTLKHLDLRLNRYRSYKHSHILCSCTDFCV